MRPLLVAALAACSSGPPAVATIPYRATFDGRLGPEWTSKSPTWRVVDGRLFNDGAHNVPLWLQAALPEDVRVTFIAESHSDAVDLKFEIFGDGEQHESGYIVILSGWNNSTSIIARRDEHGADRKERRHTAKPFERYRFECRRKGGKLTFLVNDEPHLEYDDPEPLRGRGHDRFAFNDWASKVWFDDLVIEPL
jgi:hypothetical protein